MYIRRDRGNRNSLRRMVPACACSGLFLLAGCSGGNSFLTGGPTVGQLKTALSHVEYENEQLKQRLAKLERENRSMEDRLVQEQIDNGELAARLDDARNLVKDRGRNPDVRGGAHLGAEELRRRARREDDDGTGPMTERTSTRRRRKPPVARIPGHVDVLPPVGDEDDSASRPGDAARAGDDRFDLPLDDLERQSFRGGQSGWLPLAAGSDDSAFLVR
jgi:hypothetical protein